MRRPDGSWQQREGKAQAELQRGSGHWPVQPYPCELEPPHDEYDAQSLNVWDAYVNDWQAPCDNGSVVDQVVDFFRDGPPDPLGGPPLLPRLPFDPAQELVPITVEQFTDDEATITKAEQLIRSLPVPQRPLSFEVVALGPQTGHGKARPPYITVQLLAHRVEAKALYQLLQAHYPNSAVLLRDGLQHDQARPLIKRLADGGGYVATLALSHPYVWPLAACKRLEVDPLSVAIAAMEHLADNQWSMLQVLFTPAQQPWAQTLAEAVADPYKQGQHLFNEVTPPLLAEKFASPLYAVAVRYAASDLALCHSLLGWAEQLAAPPQALVPLDEEPHENFPYAIETRCSFRPGLLLNAQELASLVHLPAPSVTSERLRRIVHRTKAAPRVAAALGSVVLGDNTHRGETVAARISAELRPRHCYVAGASGTGKSTLLLNMIRQDIESGAGVGVIDPHGDLIDSVLSLVPEHRVDDVAYFNPTDADHPPAFNVLQYRQASERQRIVSDMVTTIHRFYPDAWGPRLEHILRHALTTIVKSKVATLLHLRRLLTDRNFRQFIVSQLTDETLLSFWINEFDGFPRGAVDPILNKLSPFLLNTTIRNIICQPGSSFDFDELLNTKKIFLANLSKGSLGEEVAGVFGTFLVSKIVTAAFRRDAIPEAERQRFYLYVDEFQNFMQLSVGFEHILAEARKYKLVLAGLANQYVGQLSQSVRQAIFGNVGSLVTFRLGVDDARLVANEFGEFTAEEIMSLERGEALARMGGTQTAFNLVTKPPPVGQPVEIKERVIARSRQKYTTPRATVERGFQPRTQPAAAAAQRPSTSQPTPATRPKRPTGDRTGSTATSPKPAAAEKPQPEYLPSTPPTPTDDDEDFVS